MRLSLAALPLLLLAGCGLHEDGWEPAHYPCELDWYFRLQPSAAEDSYGPPYWRVTSIAEHEEGSISWTAETTDGVRLALEIENNSFQVQTIFLVENGTARYAEASGACERTLRKVEDHGLQPSYACALDGLTEDGTQMSARLIFEANSVCPVPAAE